MKQLSHVATRFVGTPLMIDPIKLEVIINALGPRMGIELQTPTNASEDENTQRLMAKYSEAGVERKYAVINGVAIIPVEGTLTKKLSGLAAWSGGCTYLDIEDQLQTAMNDTGVNSVLLDIDSPGGEVSGCFELVDAIYSMRGKKLIYAVANDLAASAAYAIASAADRVYVNRIGAVGSVGVFALHADQVGYDKQMGVKYTYIYAGKTKVDGNPHEPLSDRANAEIKGEVDREYKIFTETVARNRGMDVKDIVDTDARVFWGEASIPLLADEVGTFDDALNALLARGASGVTTSNTRSTATAGEGNVTTMAEVTTAAGSKPCETEEEGVAKKTQKAKQEAEGDEPDGDEDEPDGDEDKEAAAVIPSTEATAPVLAGIAAVKEGRPDEDTLAITNLCKIAGADPAKYLTRRLKTATGKERYVSVAEISNELAENRSAESERTAVMNQIENTPGSKLSIERLQAEVTATARTKGITPEKAFAQALEENPELYAQYRERHNANALIAQLQKAGVKVSFE